MVITPYHSAWHIASTQLKADITVICSKTVAIAYCFVQTYNICHALWKF